MSKRFIIEDNVPLPEYKPRGEKKKVIISMKPGQSILFTCPFKATTFGQAGRRYYKIGETKYDFVVRKVSEGAWRVWCVDPKTYEEQ